ENKTKKGPSVTLTLPFWTGAALVMAWAMLDLDRGMSRSDIRFSTPFDRYLLGIFSYGGAAFALYFAVFGAASALYYTYIASDGELIKCGSGAPVVSPRTGVHALIAAF